MTLSEICTMLHGTTSGDGNVVIEHVAKIEDAGDGDISFVANPKYRKYLATTKATAVLIPTGSQFHEIGQRKTPLHLVEVADPYISFLQLVERFHPAPSTLSAGIHPTAVIAKTATLGKNAAIGAHVVIGERCRVGSNVTLYHGTVISDDAEIGDDSLVYPNVTIREQCKIGKRAILHPGVVIGSDGFGFAPKEDGTYEKIPQRGIVVVDDDVEIGANTTIDRATLGETRIHRGVKIDNLVQIAHNVVIGEHTVIAAQTGISGSTKIGKFCIIAGQVGLVGHIEIADHTTLGAQSGVSKSITQEGKMYFGYPAKEHRDALRIEASLRQLPEMVNEFRDVQTRVAKLEENNNNSNSSTNQR